ncbi:biopolymer transporter Tol [Microbacterium sp. VKM Ac-2923]|uniref:biopolymer transporter Tol n=1 Tax=Microbacterium sp. VKM Ac-2923 TaxID=2929476 RepID=UPI001FB418B7|nr:biopolymer transporter Tol [Microbacterium sp. VKM Ac-2923]MCJ1707922.1 biopolymer transporter Tol [Microbacterium sp. VKM Ac-2923]
MASGNADDSTDDERWLVIDGRRWRRTDPVLPEDVADGLRSHLGRARAAVRSAKRSGDDEAIADVRHRVGLAKSGLGERGPRWWDDEEPARVQRARDALAELDRLVGPTGAHKEPRADSDADVNT